ncbi:MAG: oxidoreductase [Roseiflexaceae bacterium]
MTTRVVCYGLGPIGLRIARLAASRPGIAVVGAVDIDPAKAGRDLGELLEQEPLGVTISADAEEVLEQTRPHVVLHATSSVLTRVEPQLYTILAAGIHTISTCEELAFPWTTQPQVAADLDSAARRAGVALLGTGVNPGYAMDALPLTLTAPCTQVRAVRVLRVVDAALRRGPLQRKVGAGLTPAEFEEKVREGAVRHVGLPESLHMLATSLGWTLDAQENIIQPVITDHPVATEIVQVEAGQVVGVRQVASGFQAGREVLRLELRMYLGAPDPQDTVEIDGEPPVHMTIPGGLHGDYATAAMVVNAIPSIRRASPGLATMADLPLVHFWQQQV